MRCACRDGTPVCVRSSFGRSASLLISCDRLSKSAAAVRFPTSLQGRVLAWLHRNLDQLRRPEWKVLTAIVACLSGSAHQAEKR